MTRRSDLMLEDLMGCDHEPETPVSQGGEIIYWMCRCGRKCELREEASVPTKTCVECGGTGLRQAFVCFVCGGKGKVVSE